MENLTYTSNATYSSREVNNSQQNYQSSTRPVAAKAEIPGIIIYASGS